MKRIFNRDSLPAILLVVISALVYLPNGLRLTYFEDDWYYAYDGLIAGAKVFRYMNRIDRPARGFLHQLYFSIFGAHAFPYHLGEFLWRVLAALGMFWLVKTLWQRENKFAFFTALLFALYPGYFWWISAFDYQSHAVSLALQILSINFTLQALLAEKRAEKILWAGGALLLGWGYIALVDYAIGMEFFRVACIYLLIAHERRSLTFVKKIGATIRAWSVYALIPLGYVIWRTFFFENLRKATDVGLQLSVFLKEPLVVLAQWLRLLYGSAVTVGLTSWIEQFKRQFLVLDAEDMVLGFFIATIIFILLVIAEKNFAAENNAPLDQTAGEALALGAAGLTVGLLPIIIANRYVNLDFYSHYGLPASLAAAVFLAGLVRAFGNRYIRFAFFSGAIILASLAHYAISKKALDQEHAVENFWQQVAWRIPALYPDASLVTVYPYNNIMGSDEFALLEPANVIYFPEPRAELPVRYPVSALSPNNQTVEFIETGRHQKKEGYRSHETVFHYQNILLIAQPTPASCARVIDGTRYLPSEFDSENVRRVAPFSNVEIIRTGAEPRIPPDFAFGAEPAREWCYYFEQADFAAQQNQWTEAAKLGDAALERKFSPADPVEWFPFLQAYVMTDDADTIARIADEMNKSAFVKEQACLTSANTNFNPKIQTALKTLFCQ